MDQKLIFQAIEKECEAFDPAENLPRTPTGDDHMVVNATSLALSIFWYEYEPGYDLACRILDRVCDLQDTRPGRTFGLWAWNLQQCLDYDSWFFPDYNCADFLGKRLTTLCKLRGHLLPEALKEKLYVVIHNAAHCTIERNVGSDYSNIAVMSSLFLVTAGELLQDDYIFSIGKDRLDKLYRYTVTCGGFSEYNSSCYTLVVVLDVARMLGMFDDPDCLQMANTLNYYAWKLLADHYNDSLKQLSPPQVRSYTEVDTVREKMNVSSVVWVGTDGKYGAAPQVVHHEMLQFPPHCPEELLPLFEKKVHFLDETYYRPNRIRRPGEDVTIIREHDCPELSAYTYRTPTYSMGAFRLCDTWGQRRTCSVIWDKAFPKVFRVRGIHDGHDFASGMTYVRQQDNKMLGHLGLVIDRGSVHYIVDANRTGIFQAEDLHFRFELLANSENLTIRQDGKDFWVEDSGLRIRLHIAAWVFNGKEAPVYVSEDGKAVILEGYHGAPVELNTQRMDDTYGVFTMEVLENNDSPSAAPETTAGDTLLTTQWLGMEVDSHRIPVPYRRALRLPLAPPVYAP